MSVPNDDVGVVSFNVKSVAPTVGRVLHWVDGEGVHRAAVVVSEPDADGRFWLHVLGVPGATVTGWQSLFTKVTVDGEDAAGKKIGSWHFPKRV